MKKSLIVLILLCVAWTTGYFIESSRSSIPDGTMQQKALYVLDNAGCVLCHTKNAEPPFYAHIPIIGTLIKHDMSEGLKHFDMGGIVNDLKKGIPTNETILAKIESTVSDASMPPFQFQCSNPILGLGWLSISFFMKENAILASGFSSNSFPDAAYSIIAS